MILVRDECRVDTDLAAGALACPRCTGRLRPWAWATARRIRQLDGSTRLVRPRRARCAACRHTQVLLPASCLPRRADATAVIGAALLASAAGRGHRAIAADLHRPASTVRRWLRQVRGRHVDWLRRRGLAAAYRVDPDVLGDLAAQPTALGDAVQAFAGAVRAHRRRIEQHIEPWPLINILVGGRLLTPVPAD